MRRNILVLSLIALLSSTNLSSAPFWTANQRSFSEVSVEITRLSARAVGSSEFVDIPLLVTALTVNLLDLNNDLSWLPLGSFSPGEYDAIRLSIDASTARLIEQGTGAVEPLQMADPDGAVTYLFHPSLRVDAAPNAILVAWLPEAPISFDQSTNTYLLESTITAFPINSETLPVTFQALPSRVASVDVAAGTLRVSFQPLSAVQSLVHTSATTIVRNSRGNPLSLSDFAAGDLVIVRGTLDGNADFHANQLIRR